MAVGSFKSPIAREALAIQLSVIVAFVFGLFISSQATVDTFQAIMAAISIQLLGQTVTDKKYAKYSIYAFVVTCLHIAFAYVSVREALPNDPKWAEEELQIAGFFGIVSSLLVIRIAHLKSKDQENKDKLLAERLRKEIREEVIEEWGTATKEVETAVKTLSNLTNQAKESSTT